MSSRFKSAGFVWSFLAIAALTGCAAGRDVGKARAMGVGDLAQVEGVWEGQVWEMPVHYIQGVRPVTLKIARDGSWTATAAGTQCASGTASVHGGIVVLGGAKTGQDYCVPYSLTTTDGRRMRAAFETSFKGREGTAMIGLDRRSDTVQAAAQ
jgi:hypothetical protein